MSEGESDWSEVSGVRVPLINWSEGESDWSGGETDWSEGETD